MKIEAIKALRDHIAESPPEAFDMSRWLKPSSHECGTAGCLAGHVAIMCGKSINDFSCRPDTVEGTELTAFGMKQIKDLGACVLGLSNDEKEYMFYGYWSVNRHYASRAEALAYLDRVIEKGSVYV